MRPDEILGLRSLSMFGSCLSPLTRKADSIPDWFAVVDDVDAVLRARGFGWLLRRVARWLPPVTVVPKLNLIEPRALAEALAARRDLYLAGRLGKRIETVFTRDAACAAELDAALVAARGTMAAVARWGMPDDAPLDVLIRRCVSLSYDAEIRPERPEKVAALHDAFADWYRETYAPLLAAPRRPEGDLAGLLRRSRLRSVLRWPKNLLLYDGALRYLWGKLRRARALAGDGQPALPRTNR